MFLTGGVTHYLTHNGSTYHHGAHRLLDKQAPGHRVNDDRASDPLSEQRTTTQNRSDSLTLVAAFAALAAQPHVLPTPAPSAELAAYRRDAQRRFDALGLPRGLRIAA